MNTIGLNILGDRGLSDDNISAFCRRLLPHTCVVINNGKLAAMLMAQGVRVIYRHKSDKPNGNDDDATSYDAIAFVNKRNLEAPPGAIIHLTNEPGTNDIEKLNKWTLEAMKYCDQIGRKACILNFATGNPQPYHWSLLKDSLIHAGMHGHLIGHHDYFNVMAERSLKYHVGRSLPAMAKYGGQWVITELGCAVNMHPEVGWSSALSEEDYASQLHEVAKIYWLFDIPVCVYSYGSWHNFGIENAGHLQKQLVSYNADLPINAPSNAVTTTRVRVRQQPNVAGTTLGILELNAKILIEPTRYLKGQYKVGEVTRSDWYKIESPYDGWLAAAYVKETV